MMQSEPISNKQTKKNFGWKYSIQAHAPLLDLKLWECEGGAAVSYHKEENIWKQPTEELGIGDKLGPIAIFWTSLPSSAKTASLHELIYSLSWHKPVWSRLYNTNNEKSHHLSKNFLTFSMNCWHDKRILYF